MRTERLVNERLIIAQTYAVLPAGACQYSHSGLNTSLQLTFGLPDTSFLTLANSLHQPLFAVLKTLWQSRFIPRSAQHQLSQTWRTGKNPGHSEIRQQLFLERRHKHLPVSIEPSTDILTRQLFDSADIRY
jgi:hypothetical protein